MENDWAEPRQISDKRCREERGQRQGRESRPKSDVSSKELNNKELNNKAADSGHAKCMAAGVRLLAGREYSVLELTNKLSRRFNSQVVESVVEELAGLKVLDDERYGEAFCRSRVERGYGPGYIARELVQNGLDTDLIDTLLEPYQDQWFERALAQAQKAHRPKRRSFGHELDLLAGVETPVDDEISQTPSFADRNEDRGDQWKERQKAQGRLARLLARRGFSGGMASKVIDQVLREAEVKSELDSDFD
jgi:SOS response regulatory protein OraA/RecX